MNRKHISYGTSISGKLCQGVQFINGFENNLICNSEIKFIFPFSQNNENTNLNTIMQETQTFPSLKEESDSAGASEGENDTQLEISNLPTFRACKRARKIKTGKKDRPKKEYKMITPLKVEKSQLVEHYLLNINFFTHI